MRSITIATVSQTSPMGALVLNETTPVEEAVRQFAADPASHGIFLVDDNELFLGVVNNDDLLDWARLQFDLLSRDFLLPVGKVRRLLMAQTIGDLAMPDSRRMSVSPSDTLQDALSTMARFDLKDIAVVDGNGKIVNDLRISEVLTFALNAKGIEPPE